LVDFLVHVVAVVEEKVLAGYEDTNQIL
jgi:hypothetical protein